MKHRTSLVAGLMLLAPLLAGLALPTTAWAQDDDRVQIRNDITVAADETAVDVVCVFCSVRVLGRATGDVVAVMGDIEVQGSVGGDVVATGGNITLGAEAEVGDDVVSAGGKIDRHPQAQVGGKVQATPGPPAIGLSGLLLVVLALSLVIHVALVLVAYLIAGEQRVETLAATVRERGGLAALTGLGVIVAAVALFILSAFLGPVTPILAILVALGLVVTLVVGYTGMSYWLGRSLARSSAPLLALLLGAVLITVLQCIPLLGFLLFIVFSLLAFGCAALSGYGTATDWLQRQLAGRAAVPPTVPPTG